MKKALILAGLMVVALTACGKKEEAAAPAPAAQPAAEAPAKEVTASAEAPEAAAKKPAAKPASLPFPPPNRQQ